MYFTFRTIPGSVLTGYCHVSLCFFRLLRCLSLVYANFSYCEHVSDAGVELLATLPNLTSLDLSGCHLTDQGIISLGNNVLLRDLSLSECSNITDVGMQVWHYINLWQISYCLNLLELLICAIHFAYYKSESFSFTRA